MPFVFPELDVPLSEGTVLAVVYGPPVLHALLGQVRIYRLFYFRFFGSFSLLLIFCGIVSQCELRRHCALKR